MYCLIISCVCDIDMTLPLVMPYFDCNICPVYNWPQWCTMGTVTLILPDFSVTLCGMWYWCDLAVLMYYRYLGCDIDMTWPWCCTVWIVTLKCLTLVIQYVGCDIDMTLCWPRQRYDLTLVMHYVDCDTDMTWPYWCTLLHCYIDMTWP